MGMERVNKYLECVLFVLVLVGMTCLSSSMFVDGEIIPKWICFLLWVLAVGIFNSTRTLIRPAKLKVFGDKQSMSIAFVATSFIVALHGLLQYVGVLAPMGIFRVIGSFDNPAGYAMSLSMMFPFVLLGMTAKDRYLCLFSQITFVVVLVALFLTESRTGMMSILIVLVAGGHRFVSKCLVVKWTLLIVWVLLFFGFMLLKVDSALGRFLIWSVTLKMIFDHWITGYGSGGFASGYMNYQAEFLSKHPDEKWLMLADNIQHPFNEFLYVWVNHGVLPVIAMIALILYLFMCYKKEKTQEKSAAFYSIVVVFVFSMFSYPFKYPLTYFVLLYSCTFLVHDEEWVRISVRLPNYFKRILSVVFITLCIWYTYDICCRVQYEFRWACTVSSNAYGEEQMRCYDDLKLTMSDNRYFMYNYAYALYHIGDYESASDILTECSLLWADYDVQILNGLVAMKQRRYAYAKSCFDRALQMCPNRFRPLFLKLKIAEELGDTESVLECANEIRNKKIKVYSTEVVKITNYVNKLLYDYDN